MQGIFTKKIQYNTKQTFAPLGISFKIAQIGLLIILDYVRSQRLMKKCPRCSDGRLRLSGLEIFDRGAFSSRARAFKRVKAHCDTCGSVSFEQQVKCPTCNHGSVRTCSVGSIQPGSSNGIRYLMRCKSCGFIWNVSFKNFISGISEESKDEITSVESKLTIPNRKSPF